MASIYTDIPGDVWRATCACMHANKQLQETHFHVQVTVTGGNDTTLAVAAHIHDGIVTGVLPLMASNAYFLGVKLSPAKTDRPYTPVIVPANNPGTAGPNTLPTAARPLLGMKTLLAGRGYRGRMYLWSPNSNQLTPEGEPGLGVFNAWITILQDFITGFSNAASTWRLVIRHRLKKGAPGPEKPPDFVTELVNTGRFGTQHRSGDYGKVNVPPW